MKIQPVNHRTLAETVAGRLAASMIDGNLPPGDQLPPERVLMSQLGVSRATLREALKALEENSLIEFAPERWLVCAQGRRVERNPGQGAGPVSGLPEREAGQR